ncbi:MAG TPA: hypothetical protein VNQ76_15350 [Planctomicrobium sp.]|nr:hypothetical protein [Planctomicrobium sp.]
MNSIPWISFRRSLFCGLFLNLLLFFSLPVSSDEQPGLRGDLLLIVGSSGTPEYAQQFQNWKEKWNEAARVGNVHVTSVGNDEAKEVLSEVESALKTLSSERTLPLWIVLIGHGTFDGRTARFNLPGPDLEPGQLKSWLNTIQRPVAVINCFSASGPFLKELSQPGRIVITATNSGNEVNFSRFGGYLADSINNLAADQDKDQQVSLLEAFLRASALTDEFYTSDGRLPTEHALLDDNGDTLPVPATGFEGVRPVRRVETGNTLPDGVRTHQWHLCPNEEESSLSPETIARRNELELQIATLRSRKEQIPEEKYYTRLEPILLEMARLLISSSPLEEKPQVQEATESPMSDDVPKE